MINGSQIAASYRTGQKISQSLITSMRLNTNESHLNQSSLDQAESDQHQWEIIFLVLLCTTPFLIYGGFEFLRCSIQNRVEPYIESQERVSRESINIGQVVPIISDSSNEC